MSVRVFESLEARRLFADTLAVAIDGTKTFQTIDGIGAAIINSYQPAEHRSAAYLNQVFGDLGVSVVRSGLDEGWEPANDNNDPNTINWAKFDDTAIATTMEFFAQAKARGCRNFLLTVWSPSGWMKTNKSSTDGGALRPDLREEYAEYIAAALLRAKAKWGVDINYVSIANEPYYTEPYVSDIWTPQQLRETIKVVARRFKKEGLATQIVGPEDVSDVNRESRYVNTIAADAEASADFPIVGTHYLNDQDAQTLSATAAALHKKLWYTEVGDGDATLAGAVGLARGIDSAFVRAGASAWINWQLANGNPAESLMKGVTPNPKYYALKHFAHFIRPGAQRVAVNYNGDTVRVSAYKNPATGALTIELSSDRTTPVDVNLSLAGLAIPATFRQYRTSATENCAEIVPLAGQASMTVSLLPDSIVTLYAGPDLAPLTNTTASAPVAANPYAEAGNSDSLRYAAFKGDYDGVKSLIAAATDPKATVNAAFVNGWTPLFTAAASTYNRADLIVTALLNAGADPQHRDAEGMTALHVAAMSGIPAYGTQPTLAAARIRLLLAAGIGVNTLDGYGRTALHYAAMLPYYGPDFAAADTSVLKALLAAGANPAIKDALGKTALDYATTDSSADAIALLSKAAPPPVTPPPVTPPGPPAGTAQLGGSVVNDVNHDGQWTRGEVGIPGRTVWIDTNNNAAIDPGEPVRTTGTNGVYVFAGLAAGTYTLREILPAGWTQTRPAAGTAFVTTIPAGMNRAGLDFCTAPIAGPTPPVTPPPVTPPPVVPPAGTASFRAYLVNDTNKDGRWSNGEVGLVGRTVWLDLDNDGVLDAAEARAVTGVNGVFAFANLAAGTYHVRQVLPAGWKQTYPPAGTSLTITLAAGQAKSGSSLGTAKV